MKTLEEYMDMLEKLRPSNLNQTTPQEREQIITELERLLNVIFNS